MELSPTPEAASYAATQESANNLFKLKFHYRVNKSPPLVPTRRVRPIQSTPPHIISLIFALISSTHLRLGLPSGFFLPEFPPISYMLPSSPAHLILLDLTILIIHGEKFSSYEAPHYIIFSNILSLHLSSVQIFSSTSCSQTPAVCVPPVMSQTKFHTHTEPRAKF
jgi:hypothetical protein